ncbi:hypothetical protein ACFPVS_02695 [Neisseria weixii]|uniref:hypothetical protein n=1 Tax=Neisseria weixii TaxID=1853276 RepID=UPI000BB92E4F|nr:hypothetical protein [Neisseria weixii]ATD64958.1 hypothetical protein CGZ65_05805 [Neisseria weixii]
MLNKLCERAYEVLKREVPDYPVMLGEDQAFICAEFRPDWSLLGLDFDNEGHRNVLAALDDFFIETCLKLAECEKAYYVVALKDTENSCKKRLTTALSREECVDVAARLEESVLYSSKSLLVENAENWRIASFPFPEMLADFIKFKNE